VSIIMLFTLWIYLYFMSYFVYSELTLDHLPLLFDVDSQLLVNSNTLSKSYYELFYMLYILVICVIAVVGWRVEYSFIFKLNFMVNLTLVIIFSTIWSFFI
jgi:hypothetical protein